MGLENSTQNVKRSSAAEAALARASSPQSSVCSDSDIPYVSYTVNQPIGDSPKSKPKPFSPSLRSNAGSNRLQQSKSANVKQKRDGLKQRSAVHNVVVVRRAASEEDTLENDPELNHLVTIPTFLPIMRGALNIPTMSDPEVIDKLDYSVFFQLCARYQRHLRLSAKTVCAEQNFLSKRIQEIDFAVSTLMNVMTDEQKKIGNCVDKLSKITEMSFLLSKCEKMLNGTLEELDELNKLLPVNEQLEPFVLVTG